MITLTYQYKLKVNRRQEREIVQILDVCQSVYNSALAERKDWIKSRKCPGDRCSLVFECIIPADEPCPNYFAQAKNLTEAKKAYPLLKTVNAQVLQQVLRTLDRAFSDMKAKGFRFPRFKKKRRSFVFPALSKAHHLCDFADNIFVEDINFVSWSRGTVRKQSLDSGIGSFINEILPFVIWKRGKFYLKVDKNGTWQECPHCGAFTGKKSLSERVHRCDSCGHVESRDTASAKVIENRGNNAVGLTGLENARGGDLVGIVQLNLFDLAKSLRTENPPLHRASG